jgi:hypothetical protein
MRVTTILVLLAAGVSFCAAQPAKKQPAKPATPAAKPQLPVKADAVADGVFVGRSGKPMAKARVFLGEVSGDEDFPYAVLRLPNHLPSAVTDDQGRFQFKNFPPGRYTIVYQPAGAAGILPVKISIKALSATDQNIAPGLRGIELGKTDPFPDRPWTNVFTLLKGHTLMTQGDAMKIWNATVRRNPGGPYLEIRRGQLWLQQLGDKSQIKLDAWSY